jgi:hypothetical protein
MNPRPGSAGRGLVLLGALVYAMSGALAFLVLSRVSQAVDAGWATHSLPAPLVSLVRELPALLPFFGGLWLVVAGTTVLIAALERR